MPILSLSGLHLTPGTKGCDSIVPVGSYSTSAYRRMTSILDTELESGNGLGAFLQTPAPVMDR